MNHYFRSYNDHQNISKELKVKFNESLKLYGKMFSVFPHERPNCEEILERKKKWALNEEEFEINEFEKIIDSKENENELTIYSMLRSKMTLDKAIKSIFKCVIS